MVYDQSELVDEALGGVTRAVLLGALMVVLVLFALLGDARAAALVTLSIPLSVAISGVLLEQLPGAEEVQSGAEAGFADHQALAGRQLGKASGQIVLQQEGMAGFSQTAVAGEIHIGKLPRARLTVGIPVELGVLEVGGAGLIGHGAHLATRRAF